jgi:PilZ domain
MSTTGQAPLQAFARGRAPRRPLAVPVMVTVLRPDTAHSVTRRALNLGEGGIAISFALPDEVRVSDAVAVGFLLPDLGLGLQARAVVRYRTASHSGLQFRDLTRYQQAAIREWMGQRQSEPDQNTGLPAKKQEPRRSRYYSLETVVRFRRLVWLATAVLALLGLIAWWHWQRAWKELEDKTHQPTAQVARVPISSQRRL